VHHITSTGHDAPISSRPYYSKASEGISTEQTPARPTHRNRAAQGKRQRQFAAAAVASSAAQYPLTFTFCLTWDALARAGERRDGHCLHLPEAKRVSRLWRNLKSMCRRHGLTFIAMRGPEYDARKGSHMHVSMHLPDYLLPDLVNILTHITGAPADIATSFTASEMKRGYKARSACRGWLVQRNMRAGNGGDVRVAEYLSKASSRAGVVVQYRLSDALSALVKAQALATGGALAGIEVQG
jgi:hypothetical protein